MLWKQDGKPRKAEWPFRLPESLTPDQVEAIRRRVEEVAAQAQYGWGQTIDFGPFARKGVVEDKFLDIVGVWDDWGWWPRSLRGLRVADIGAFTGGVSLIAAHRGAEVLAVDEIPAHLAQCDLLCQVFNVTTVKTLMSSLYTLPGKLEKGSFDIIVLSGVLYHLSDMLVGLLVMRDLLKVGGLLLIESTAVDDVQHSYANFGRFAMGIWWQPSTLCIKDMCHFMGLPDAEVRMYLPDRCVARVRKTNDDPIPYRRGLTRESEDLRDATPRSMDPGLMAPK